MAPQPRPITAAGFTYVEMLIVIAVSLLLAGLAMPNLVGRKKSRDEWAFKSDLRYLPVTARSRAINTGRETAVVFDKTKREFQLLEQAPGFDQPSGQANQPFKTLALPDFIDTKQFTSDANSSTGDNWRMSFYPDGGTSGGGVELADGDETFSLIVSPLDSVPDALPGALPDLSVVLWSAGGNGSGN